DRGRGGPALCRARHRGPGPDGGLSRLVKKAYLLRWTLARPLHVQELRLACGPRAPPRRWTFLTSLRFSRGGAGRAWPERAGHPEAGAGGTLCQRGGARAPPEVRLGPPGATTR